MVLTLGLAAGGGRATWCAGKAQRAFALGSERAEEQIWKGEGVLVPSFLDEETAPGDGR